MDHTLTDIWFFEKRLMIIHIVRIVVDPWFPIQLTLKPWQRDVLVTSSMTLGHQSELIVLGQEALEALKYCFVSLLKLLVRILEPTCIAYNNAFSNQLASVLCG